MLQANEKEWKIYFEDDNTHKAHIPAGLNDTLNQFEKMCVLRCMRPDKISDAVQGYVTSEMGMRFIEPPPFDSSCDTGYTISNPPAAGSAQTCNANTCASIQVANSNNAAANSITGKTGETQLVTCNAGYSGDGTGRESH